MVIVWMRRASALLALLSLAACGGGGGSSGTASGPTQSVAPPTPTAQVVLADAQVSLGASIGQYVTPAGTSTSGSAVPAATGSLPVLALDRDRNLLMAGSLTGGQTATLTADSTALVLARFMLNRPTGVSDAQFVQAIQGTAAYPSLVRGVTSALQSATPPVRSAAVVRSLLDVGAQTAQALLNASNAAATPVVAEAKLDPGVSVRTPLPFSLLVSESFGPGRLALTDKRKLTNTFPIMWAVEARTGSGTPIASTPDTIKGASGFLTRAFAAEEIELPGDKGRAFEITVRQTDFTRIRNVGSLIYDAAVEAIGNDTCTAAAVQVVATKVEFLEMITSFSVASLTTFLETLVVKGLTPGERNGLLSSCANDTRWEDFVLAKLGTMVPVFKLATTINSFATLADKFLVISNSYRESRAYTVCTDAANDVVNCATRYERVPDAEFYLITGDSYLTTLKAFTSTGAATGVSADVATTTTAEMAYDAATQRLKGISAGLATLTLTDPSTSTVSTQTVPVISPVFLDATRSITADEVTKVYLVHPADVDGRRRPLKVYDTKDLYSLSSSDPAVVQLVRSQPVAADGLLWVEVRGLLKGKQATLEATNLQTGVKRSIVLSVAEVGCTAALKAQFETAVLGNWKVADYEMELKSGGVAVYRAGGKEYLSKWRIAGWDEPVPAYWSTGSSPLRPLGVTPGCILYDTGFWHPAYDGLVRSNLQLPLTGFEKYELGGPFDSGRGNYFGTDLSKQKVSITYRKN